MARDLMRAQANQPKMAEGPKPPALDITPKPAPPAIPAKPLAISDILAQARKRAEVKPLSPPPPPPQKPTVEDILPIEEKLAAIIEPPDNLPTGQEVLEVPKPAPPKPPTPLLQAPMKPVTAPKLMTPEEILGLSPRPAAEEKAVPQPLPRVPPEIKKHPPIQIPVPPKPARHGKPGVAGGPGRPISRLKFALAAGILGFISILVIGGLIWKTFIQAPPPVPPPIPTGPTVQPLPKSLIRHPLNQIEEVEITQLSYDALKPKLDTLQGFLPDTLAYTPIKIRTEKEIRYLTLSELFETLQIDAPPTFFDYAEYSIFLYTQKLTSKTLCETASVRNSLCSGPRLGLVMKLPEDITASAIAFETMKEWEKTLEEDFHPLMLFVPQKGQQKSFEVGKHGELDTHYLNLPTHTMSIDWILAEKHLIIATSKDAARAALDNLGSP